jgi:hypothetical protein
MALRWEGVCASWEADLDLLGRIKMLSLYCCELSGLLSEIDIARNQAEESGGDWQVDGFMGKKGF